MSFKFRLKRRWFRFKIWLSTRKAPLDPKAKLSSEQEKAIQITKKLISDSHSKLYAAITKEQYLIDNGHIFIKMTSSRIRIINGTYKYDFMFSNEELKPVIRMFVKSLEHKQEKLLNEISSRVEKSLNNILEELED